MNNNGIKFLDRLYQNLYMSDVVQHTKENKDSRIDAIRKYLERLDRVATMADTESKKKHLLNLLYKKYVIKEEDIPKGHNKEEIIANQKKSLSLWVDYLTDPNTSYPLWTKYWAFQGMLKMGSFDEGIGKYLTRNKKTLAPFVSANPEIIAKSIETVMKLVDGEERNEITESRLSKTDSFSKIYSLFEKKYKEAIVDETKSTEGIWVKYNQGSEDDAKKLSSSLENKNTGWCTAGESTAKAQLCGPYDDSPDGGDFYVFYTKDKDGNFTIPRIAIRLSGKTSIGEIRGIEQGQNLEDSMVDVLKEKLQSMSFLSQDDVNKNLSKVEDLKKLSKILIKHKNNERLTGEELTDLYFKKFGFGWTQDPRIGKILKERNTIEDFEIGSIESRKEFLLKCILPFSHKVTDRKLIIECIKENGILLGYASEELKNDKEIVLMAVKQNGDALCYASEELKNDREIVLAAVKQYGDALGHASEELRNDREIVLAAVKQNILALSSASEELKNDREIILECVRESGLALKYASEELENDREIVLIAVNNYGGALAFASETLKGDREVVLTSVKYSGFSLFNASKELKNDKEIVLAAVNQNGLALQFASEELKNDKEIVLTAVKNDVIALYYASEELSNDKDIVLTVVKHDGTKLLYASKELRDNKEIVLAAVNQNGNALQFASPRLKNDRQVVSEAVKNDNHALMYASEKLRKEYEFITSVKKELITAKSQLQEYKEKQVRKITEKRKLIRKSLFGFIPIKGEKQSIRM